MATKKTSTNKGLPPQASRPRAIELFTGAGGLALGTSLAGFEHQLLLEWNQEACETIRTNMVGGVVEVHKWPLHQGDIRKFSFNKFKQIDLVAGGPPCQPFSIGGKHLGAADGRNLFSEVVRTVRETSPKAVLIENVKGLLRSQFAKFFEYVTLQLSYPEVEKKGEEDWVSHLNRLEQHRTSGSTKGLVYNVVFRCLNAADFGVPQKRFRVFIVGFRSDLNVLWNFPKASHSQDALIQSQYVSGEYWDKHKIAKARRPRPSESIREKINLLKGRLFAREEKAWVTVRDAISDLPKPSLTSKIGSPLNHILKPGAKSYVGHTGSPIDEPAKTLKAGDHGVPGGENMIAYPNGEVRYFTVRESARLQTFPDEYEFSGPWSEAMRQIGNAVPVKLARAVAESVIATLP